MATLEAPVRPRTTLHQGPFVTEPFYDFRNEENARRMRAAIAKVRGQLGREYDLIIGGKRVKTTDKIKSLNPSQPSQIVGIHQKAGKEHVEPAMQAALKAFAVLEPHHRRRARQPRLPRRRSHAPAQDGIHGLAGLRSQQELGRGRRRHLRDHRLLRVLRARSSALRQGANAHPVARRARHAALHSARRRRRDSAVELPLRHHGRHDARLHRQRQHRHPEAVERFADHRREVPRAARRSRNARGRRQLLPRRGASFGDAVVAHPKTRYIAFTGSREVGLHINKVAATQAPGQIWIKRTILEMGGKDAIIVDADADIDSAVEGVAQAAFGFQGQKCSACSRAIVDERVYDKFLEQLKARVEKIQIGDVAENAAMGAVINEGSMKTILEYIEQGKKDGRLITGGERAPGEGYFIQPTVIADIPPKSKLEQEEIFGPVLAVIKARGFDHALEIANDTEFGLTGAVYTKSRDKIDRAIQEFHVGNLYINRKCTGAMVGAHPFGGFNMSGTDSKSGGPDYLYLFTQAKAVGEKIS